MTDSERIEAAIRGVENAVRMLRQAAAKIEAERLAKVQAEFRRRHGGRPKGDNDYGR